MLLATPPFVPLGLGALDLSLGAVPVELPEPILLGLGRLGAECILGVPILGGLQIDTP